MNEREIKKIIQEKHSDVEKQAEKQKGNRRKKRDCPSQQVKDKKRKSD